MWAVDGGVNFPANGGLGRAADGGVNFPADGGGLALAMNGGGLPSHGGKKGKQNNFSKMGKNKMGGKGAAHFLFGLVFCHDT